MRAGESTPLPDLRAQRDDPNQPMTNLSRLLNRVVTLYQSPDKASFGERRARDERYRSSLPRRIEYSRSVAGSDPQNVAAQGATGTVRAEAAVASVVEVLEPNASYIARGQDDSRRYLIGPETLDALGWLVTHIA